MIKILTTLLISLFPALVLAQDGGGALSFAPPATDYSVIFLGNLFGIVDGVLHGTGSQIMGTMFGVFNAAVLALGGIVIMYTLMVSTMNTAHEGQMLGQKWSSIWIPVRSTLGLALLIPKASGYCLMQIFVMWVVIQGVGAADKIWEAALSYLNRGGVIIQAQINPGTALLNSGTSGVAEGASSILSGQVCMLGLQKQLDAQRQTYLSLKQNNSGPCSGTPSASMNTFCSTAVPDFLGTVNAVIVQNNNKTANSFSVQMPNFDSSTPYNALNGICGTIAWNPINQLSSIPTPGSGSGNATVGGIGNITSSELQTAQLSRAIAIQQMYNDLGMIAQVMVNNSPTIGTPSQPYNAKNNFSLVATQQFGVPYTANGSVCSIYSQTCTTWGISPGSTAGGSGLLFNGTEFQGALSDYNGIMMPTLNLLQQASNASNANNSRQFITQATQQGWMMAGSYFYNLVVLNGGSAPTYDAQRNQTDTATGLDKSIFDATLLTSAFGQNSNCTGQYALLCQWFGQDKTKVSQVEALIDGSIISTNSAGVPVTSTPVIPPSVTTTQQRPLVSNQQSSTVFGFINNSLMIQLPDQPGLVPLKFADNISFSVDTTPYKLQPQNFACGQVKIIFFSFCLGQMFGDLFYNVIFLFLYNTFMTIFQQLIDQLIMAFLMIPLQGMAGIFQQGMTTISKPGVNPIVALANMGTMYINFSGELWLTLMTMSIGAAFFPPVFALIMLGMPLIIAWVSIMVGIGFITAYYIPILPYLIFTFGSIAWLIAVIEAMVAAPIVALGVTHPEGHDAFGKGEAAIMILMNIFLRPSMMIIGYISGIALSYVGVWILNAGFDQAIGFIQSGAAPTNPNSNWYGFQGENPNLNNSLPQAPGSGAGNYTSWAGIFAFFFSILSYTMLYLTIVQKSFTLISHLPDKVLRWIGGQENNAGAESAQWGDELKNKTNDAGKDSATAQGQIGKTLSGYGQKGISAARGGAKSAGEGQGDVSGQGTDSTKSASAE